MPTGLELADVRCWPPKACVEQTASVCTRTLKTVISTYPHLFVLSYSVKKVRALKI